MIGLNLSAADDWQTGRYWTDLKNLFREWGQPDKPYERPAVPFALSADGYPLADFGGFAEIRNYPSGLYQFAHAGSGTLTWKAGVTTEVRTAPNRGTVVLDGESRNLSFKVSGVNPADPFRDLSLRRATAAGDFDPDFLASLKPFGVLRFMDWQATNFTTQREWADRPTPAGQQTVPGKGVALEHCLSLARLTGASPWLCVPHTASDDYVRQMAVLVANRLGSSVPVYLEISNEVWNGGTFPATYNGMLAAAKANPALDATDPNARLYQHVAWRLANAVAVFMDAGVKVVGVLAGQAVNPWLAEQGLDYLNRKYGSKYVGAYAGVLAYADYFLTDTDFPAGLSSGLARSAAWAKTHRTLADKYGVPVVAAYEGGQHLIGGPGGNPAKLAANLSPELGDVYRKALAAFQAAAGPGAVWCAFASPADWGDGRDGYWGLSPRLGASTPKLAAVLEAAGADPPPLPPSPPPPAPAAGFTGTLTYVDGRLMKVSAV